MKLIKIKMKIPSHTNIEGIFPLQELIDYLEKTSSDNWMTKVCRRDNKNCLLGHVFEFGGGETKEEGATYNKGTKALDFFEGFYATTYMFYPVNDGEHPKYQQPTAKERCITYLKDLRDGKEKTTIELLAEYESKY